jgi:hypothetical protein
MSRNRLQRPKLGQFLLDDMETVVALALGVAVLVLAVFNDLSSTATLLAVFSGLLIAVSFGMLRDRWRREALVARVESLVAGLESEKAWEALEVDCAWDIDTLDGSHASASTKRKLRFARDEVLTVYEFSHSAGSTQKPTCVGRFGDEAPRKLDVLDEEFPGPLGRRYRIISLDGIRRRGDQAVIQTDRELIDSFREDRESVSFTPEVSTDKLKMSVTWPVGGAPTGVWLETKGERQHVIGDVKPNANNRSVYVCEFTRPSLGYPIAIVWEWKPSRAGAALPAAGAALPAAPPPKPPAAVGQKPRLPAAAGGAPRRDREQHKIPDVKGQESPGR